MNHQTLSLFRSDSENSESFFDLAQTRQQIQLLEDQTKDPALWDDRQRASKLTSELSRARSKVGKFDSLDKRLGDLRALCELLAEERDPALEKESKQGWTDLDQDLAVMEKARLFGHKDDVLGAIVVIHPGAGGTESQDWAQMLLRMLTRWAERRGFTARLLDLAPGEEAGIKAATLEVEGEYAYGNLRAEKGVHRLVRISPFDANARRHTSFASVMVLPAVDDAETVEIRDADLRVDTYRAGGAGGQHVNKTDSAVRITHLPTGIVVQCQNERSQHKNKASAMKVLRARLYEDAEQKRMKEKAKKEGEKKDIAWGSQIRSYVLQPYQMVKDHRSGMEVGDVNRILDGDLDALMEAALKAMKT